MKKKKNVSWNERNRSQRSNQSCSDEFSNNFDIGEDFTSSRNISSGDFDVLSRSRKYEKLKYTSDTGLYEYPNKIRSPDKFRRMVEAKYGELFIGQNKNFKVLWRSVDQKIDSMNSYLELNSTKLEGHFKKRMKFLEVKNRNLEMKILQLEKRKKRRKY